MLARGFYESHGTDLMGSHLLGVGLNDRVNKWLSVYTRFVQLRRNETAPANFFPAAPKVDGKRLATYIVGGFNVSDRSA